MTHAPTSRAVVERRHSALDGLDYFPTPPWATRALVEKLGATMARSHTMWEPAAGGGHMAEVLLETHEVWASDVHDYGVGYAVGSFIGEGPDVARAPWRDGGADWIVTNPPFALGVEFVETALAKARVGVAMLVRTAFLEGGARHDLLFAAPRRKPRWIFQFAGRVPMQAGTWNPEGRTATAYAWVVWLSPRVAIPCPTEFDWIDPDAKRRLWRDDDVARFAGEVAPCAVTRCYWDKAL